MWNHIRDEVKLVENVDIVRYLSFCLAAKRFVADEKCESTMKSKRTGSCNILSLRTATETANNKRNSLHYSLSSRMLTIHTGTNTVSWLYPNTRLHAKNHRIKR